MYSVSKSILVILFSLVFYNLGFSQSQFVAPKSSLNQGHLIDTLKNKTSVFSKTYRNAEKGYLPYYQEKTPIQQSFVPSFEINIVETRELTQQELEEIKDSKPFIKSDYNIEYFTVTARLQNYICAKINAVRLNANSGKYEVLVSYTPKWNENTPHSLSNSLRLNNTSAKINTATNSVLATGKWYKVGLTKEGVYKIDKAFLKSLGIDVDNTDPRNIRVYGNGGKLMPEKNSVFRHDDLQENAIVCVGESDGVIDDNDYILFYGQSTDYWRKVPGSKMPYEHQTHYFSDTSYYFITADLGLGKRVNTQTSLANTPNTITSKQDYYDFHEQNTINVVKSGREFYGEKFDINTNYVFSFSIPDAAIGDSVYVKAGVLSRANTASSYMVNFSGSSFTFTCAPTNTGSYLADVGYFGQNSAGGILNTTYLSVNISKQTAQAVGWLDKIEFSARRNLVFGQNQFNFRDRKTVVGAGTFAQYQIINNNSTAPTIWDVTDKLNIKNQQYNISVNNIDFISTSDSLREFVAFVPSQAYTPKAYGTIPNQNLHGTLQADYVIVTHPSFLSHAQRIAKLHQDYDSLTYVIATTDQVYNEFSSGTPDIGGIRDFVKMLYYKPLDPTKATKYLMLLGDGSYKNKEINVSGNTALIPTYETPLSSSYTTSFVSDDYFGMMDIFEGDVSTTDVVDVGVGRLMVKNKEEADVVTSKIEQYYKLNYNFDPNAIESSCTTAENNYPQGDWRNWVCFIADDEDNNLHINDANDIADKVYNYDKNYNVDKIFLDSYVQYSTPGGDRYPDAVNDLNRRIERGALIVNYTGHGGELGLAEERIVEVSQILNWSNKNNLPLFVTATCEFSRFDDPDRTSAGEYCLLSEKGGAIGLMTTCRLAFSGSNKTINDNFYDYALQPMSNGKMPHLGDVYRLTKESVPGSVLFINFVLLGDPALKLSYPQQRVYTSTVNSNTVTPASSDTLKALSLITVTGYVGDKFGNKLSNFNGVVYSTVFDKEALVYTLKNDPTSAIRSFKQQKNIVYKGKSEAKNGDFSFSFLVPKDISYSYGKGKFSYYAHNGIIDAQGYYDKVVVGGANNNATTDNQGPTISLFMNDERFVSGGLTNESPKVYAKVSDLSGINTIGTGIGHDIVAILDENTKNAIVLNDYYVSDINTFQSGKIRYPMNSLPEGNHTLSLKVWDVQNNSSSSTIDFVVANQADLALTHVLNYPNPFTSKTKFFIEHNQCCTSLKVVIQIYTVSGKMVKSIVQPVYNEGFRFDGIEWDGKDDFGDKLARGVYIYKVSITDDSKRKADKIEKLVILN